MNLNKLKIEFNKVATKFIKEFCRKHEIEFSGAVTGEDLFSHLTFNNEIVITLEDVITDLELNVPSSHLTQWWYDLNITNNTSYSVYLRKKIIENEPKHSFKDQFNCFF